MIEDVKNATIQSSDEVRRFIAAALIPLAACGLQWFFWTTIEPYVWFLFYPAVFFSSWVGGLRGGIMATVLAAGLVWYFFIPAQYSFAIDRPMHLVSIGVFVGMGFLFSVFHERLRSASRRADGALSAVQSFKNQLEDKIQQRTAELQQANTRLRESENRLRLSVQSGNVGLWDWDLVSNRVYYSLQWKRQIGYEEEL